MQTDPQAVFVTGPFGTGKSSVAIEIVGVLEKRGPPYAVVDLDWLCWGWAGGAEGSEHRMMPANLAPVVATTSRPGCGTHLRSIRQDPGRAREPAVGPVHAPSGRRDGRAMLRDRAPSRDGHHGGRQDDLREAKLGLAAGEGVGMGDISVPNDRSLRDVASDILGRLGWADVE